MVGGAQIEVVRMQWQKNVRHYHRVLASDLQAGAPAKSPRRDVVERHGEDEPRGRL